MVSMGQFIRVIFLFLSPLVAHIAVVVFVDLGKMGDVWQITNLKEIRNVLVFGGNGSFRNVSCLAILFFFFFWCKTELKSHRRYNRVEKKIRISHSILHHVCLKTQFIVNMMFNSKLQHERKVFFFLVRHQLFRENSV